MKTTPVSFGKYLMRRRIDRICTRQARRKRLGARIAKSTDGILLLLCLAGFGLSGGDERLVNGFRLFAAMIQRHARFYNGTKCNSALTPPVIRPLRSLH